MANVEDSKLDKILGHMDQIHDGINELRNGHKQLSDRLDAVEAEREKEKADAKARKDAERVRADRARRDGEDDTTYADRLRRMDAECIDRERRDGESEAEHAERVARMDAEREERERADTAGRIVDDAVRRKVLESIEKDFNKFADAQMRCDRAYQAWGKQAPHALYGEQLRDFRIRLLTPLKQHSRVYKDSALSLAGDDAAFRVIEDAIINDAVEASYTTFTMGAPLREQVTRSESGHIVRKFIGDPAVTWARFMGGATKFGRINMALVNKAR